MPVEIRELVLKIVLEETPRTKIDPEELQSLKNKIVKECTEKVLAKLENITER